LGTQDWWNDAKAFETVDKCTASSGLRDLTLGYGRSAHQFAVQPLWSNEVNGLTLVANYPLFAIRTHLQVRTARAANFLLPLPPVGLRMRHVFCGQGIA
jgi:hypothetical protein